MGKGVFALKAEIKMKDEGCVGMGRAMDEDGNGNVNVNVNGNGDGNGNVNGLEREWGWGWMGMIDLPYNTIHLIKARHQPGVHIFDFERISAELVPL